MNDVQRAYTLPYETESISCVGVLEGRRPVLLVNRADGDWVLLCGQGHPEDDTWFRVGEIGHLIDRDPTLRVVLDLLPGEEAERIQVGAPWIRSQPA